MATIVESVVQKAVDDLWQRPNQDRVAHFNAVPVSPSGGVRAVLKEWNMVFSMPDTQHRYVVYSLGQLNPQLYGFDEYMVGWKSFLDVSNDEEMSVELLVNNRRLPLKHSYIVRTYNHATLIAVRMDKCFGLLDTNPNLHISFYSNAWFYSADGVATTKLTATAWDVTSDADKTAAWTEWEAAKLRTSIQKMYINGLWRDLTTASEIPDDCYLEIIEDASGLGHYDIALATCPFFLSTLDSRGKYLLLAPDNARNEVFNYLDDIDIVIYNNVTEESGAVTKRGIVYDLFNGSDIRMVTHRDHSIDSVRVKDILKNQNQEVIQTGAVVRVYYRQADLARPFPDDGQYIKDMYLFNRDDRKAFMVGTKAVIDQWKAAELEQSNYVRWLGLNRFKLSYENARNVYSYHGLYNMAELPVKDGTNYQLPPVAENGGLILQYNADFDFVGVDTVATGGVYPLPAGVEYIEFIPGENVTEGVSLENSVGTIDPQGLYNEEYFVRDPNNHWLQAELGTHYHFDGTNIVFEAAYGAWPKLKRSSGKYTMRYETGLTRASLIKDGINVFANSLPALDVPTARVDVILNSKKLIRDLDYRVEWPMVYIHNVEWLTTSNDVRIIAHGLPRDYNDTEVRFIENGYVNYDEKFRLDFNRPVEITIDGKLGVKEEVAFSERRVNTMNAQYREGAPYTIVRPPSRVPTIYQHELTEDRETGLAIDTKLENYLSTLDRETITPVTNVITNKHEIASIVMQTVIDDLNDGKIHINNDSMSTAAVASAMSRYRTLLTQDPTLTEDWDWGYVEVTAHNLDGSAGLSALHYAFVEKVNELYFDSRIKLSNYLHVV